MGKIEDKEASFRVNMMLRQVDRDLSIQVVMRERALRFVRFVRSYKLDDESSNQ